MIDESFRPLLVISSPLGPDAFRHLNLLRADRGPVIAPAVLHPEPLPFIPGFDDMTHINPLFHTPAAIHRSVEIGANRTASSSKLKLAMTVALLSTATQRTSFRVTSTGGLRERVKQLEKTLQKHPTRNDIKLQIMELRNQIREIEAENAKARKAQTAAKVKKRK